MSKNPLDALPGNLGNNLGDYLREQRLTKKLSLRQLSHLAGISNPYLSQIERGVKRPSAEILQQIAKGLSISAETLYVQAGLLDPKDMRAEAAATTRAAIAADPALTARQRQTLLEIYESFAATGEIPSVTDETASAPTTSTQASPRKTAKKTAAKKTAATKASPQKAAAKRTTRTTAKKTAGSTKGSAASTGPTRTTKTPRSKA
ncbi:MAG TPA: helix-turn-helix domain-containing protein [Candidatus Janibacter merdipullorum]|nr:helix-turn-helix domain-containing protein [Candidatus Janibacter merdipullorum]